MRYSVKFLLFIITVCGMAACEETVLLDLEQTRTLYVIDAQLTNEFKRHYVKVSTTNNFYQSGQTPRVSGASVKVTDHLGTVRNYVETEPGLYLSEEPFEGVKNGFYQLEVVADGHTFISSDSLFRTAEITGMRIEIDEDERDDPEEEGYYHELIVSALEPQETKDYYLFKFYRNDSIQNDDYQFVSYADDEFVRENIDNLYTQLYFAPGDEAKFEIYSLTVDAYTFYNDMDGILNNDGGMFGAVPANPRTNIVNTDGLGLGLFQVSAVVRDSILVQ